MNNGNIILGIFLLVLMIGVALAVIGWGVFLNWIQARVRLRSPRSRALRYLGFALMFATVVLAVSAKTQENPAWDIAATSCALAALALSIEVRPGRESKEGKGPPQPKAAGDL